MDEKKQIANAQAKAEDKRNSKRSIKECRFATITVISVTVIDKVTGKITDQCETRSSEYHL